MTKRNADLKEAQPDLLGGAPPPAAKAAEPVRAKKTAPKAAEPAPAPKGSNVAVFKPKPPAKPKEPKSMLAVLADAVTNPAVDVDKLERLLAVQERIQEREALREFNVALLAAQGEVPAIVKNRTNTSTHSKFADLETVSKHIDHIARVHGFTMSFGTDDSPLKDHYRVICDLGHSGGFTRRYKIDLKCDDVGPKGEKNKTAVQGTGSTTSYGRRYLKVMMFDLVIVGEDNDGNRRKPARAAHVEMDRDPDLGTVIDGEVGEPVISTKQHDDLTDAIEACGVGRARFCKTYGIKAIADLPARLFAEAAQSCKNYAARVAERVKGGAAHG